MAGDYAGGNELWKYQWDYIHNPEGGWFIFEDSEEGMMRNDGKYFVKINDILINDSNITGAEIKAIYDDISATGSTMNCKEFDVYFFGEEFNATFASYKQSRPGRDTIQTNDFIWCYYKNGNLTDSISSIKTIEKSANNNDELLIYVKYNGYWIPIFNINLMRVEVDLYFNSSNAEDFVLEKILNSRTAICGTNKLSLIPKFKKFDHWVTYKDDSGINEQSSNVIPEDAINIFNIESLKFNNESQLMDNMHNWTEYNNLNIEEHLLEIASKDGHKKSFTIELKEAPNLTIYESTYHRDGNIGVDSYDSYKHIDNGLWANEYEKSNNNNYIPEIIYSGIRPPHIRLNLSTLDSVEVDMFCRYNVSFTAQELTANPVVFQGHSYPSISQVLEYEPKNVTDARIYIKDDMGNDKGEIKVYMHSIDPNNNDNELKMKLIRLQYDGIIAQVTQNQVLNHTNKLYNQVGYKWAVTQEIIIDLSLPENLAHLQNGISESYGEYSFTTINRILKNGASDNNVSDKQAYVHILRYINEKIIRNQYADNQNLLVIYAPSFLGRAGYAVSNSNRCFISPPLYSGNFTVAHELGHLLGINHIGVDLGKCANNQDTDCEILINTNNIMGYGSNKYSFWKWQRNKLTIPNFNNLDK